MSTAITPGKAPKNFDELADLWLAEIEISGVTHRAYRLELGRFTRWARSAGVTLARADSQSFSAFGSCISSDRPRILHPLGVSKPLLASSLGQTRRIVGAWLRWAAAEGWVSPTLAAPAAWPHIDRKSPPRKGVAAKQLDHVLVPAPRRGRIGLRTSREQFVAGLTFWLGMSPHEVAALRRTDIRVRDRRLEVRVGGSDGSADWIPAAEPLLHAWEAYDKERGASEYAVTNTRAGLQVSIATVTRIVRGIKLKKTSAGAAGPINSRELRRSFVKHALGCGWSSDDLKRHLRRQTLSGSGTPRATKQKWMAKLEVLDSSLS